MNRSIQREREREQLAAVLGWLTLSMQLYFTITLYHTYHYRFNHQSLHRRSCSFTTNNKSLNQTHTHTHTLAQCHCNKVRYFYLIRLSVDVDADVGCYASLPMLLLAAIWQHAHEALLVFGVGQEALASFAMAFE
jgi:hypothetical protein